MARIKHYNPDTEQWEYSDNAYISSQNPNVDLTGYAKTEDIPTKVSQLDNDAGYLTKHQEPLIGTTDEITPSQVLEAIQSGRDVLISHIDEAWGSEVKFSYFAHAVAFSMVLANGIFTYGNNFYLVELYGSHEYDAWFATSAQLAQSTDIPTALKNPNALTINGTSYDGSAAVNMTIGGNGNSGDGIPEYIKAEAERVAKLVQSRQNANTISFLACSDIHYYSPSNATANANAESMHEAVTSMGQAMALIRERVHIDFATMFGDMTWDYGETRDELLEEMRFVNACLHDGFLGIPQFRMEGNHDDAYESGGNLTASEIFSNIGIWNDGVVHGNREAGYCYRDFENVKLRVICLNTTQYSGSSFFTDSAQVTWLAQALNLSNKGADWRSIILSHHPLDWGKAGGTNPTDTINAASGLIASFHGHIHNFLTGTVTNTELPRISIPNAGYSRENQYGETYGVNWKESTTYAKTPGTAENTSFCVITIDLAEKKIYADHYGAGYDRVIPFDDAELATFKVTNNLTNVTTSNASAVVYEGSKYSATLTANDGYELKSVTVTMGGSPVTVAGGVIDISGVTGDIVITAVAEEITTGDGGGDSGVTYTNLVPSATTTYNGTEIYNSPNGYKNGAYVSSGNNFGTDANCVAVGFLKLNLGDVIYIKGAELAKQSHVRLYTVTLSGSPMHYCENPDVSTGQWISTTGLACFTIEVLGDKYYKLTPTEQIAEDLYYRVSLYGTGENLVITHNQPIE